MTKHYVLSIFVLFLSSLCFSQDDDTDSKSFFSVGAGVNTTQINATGELFNDSQFGTGYSLGVYFTSFPDYEFGSFFLRVGLEYIAEKSSAQSTSVYQNEPVLTEGDLKLLGFHFLGAYRFKYDSKFDPYLGGGLSFQSVINDPDEAFAFVRENGEEFPVYTSNVSAPNRFRVDAPKTILGVLVEFGGFIPVSDKLINIAAGLQYGFFLSKNSESLSLDKTSIYLKANYELF